MNHDMSHCDAEITPGELCTRRNTCFRYIAHLDLVEHPISHMGYLNAYDCVYPTETSEAWSMYETL